MSAQSICWTTVLIVFGLAALFVGTKLLVILIPAAMLIWYGLAEPLLRNDRN